MSDTAITIENVSKRYRYGGTVPLSHNLRADITEWTKGLFRRGQPRHATLHEVQEKHLDESPEYFWALKEINLEIKQGEIVGIIGRNGAGKSTLLKILSRITPPTTGTITYHGRVASLLEVGTGFHRELTGRENVFLNGSILGMKRSEITGKLDEIIAFAEVEKFIDTPVKFYSSGMYVRLAFAVAAHLQPEILIVDEVLAVGDAGFQKKCLGKMGEVATQGRTTLFVTHNMMAIEHLCGRAVFLKAGRVQTVETTKSSICAYLSSFERPKSSQALGSLPRECGLVPVIQRLEFCDEDGQPIAAVKAMAPLVVRVHYRHTEPIRDPYFGLSFQTPLGVSIFWVQTRLQKGLLPDLPATGVVECRIPQLSLYPGSYVVVPGCGAGTKQLDLLPQGRPLQVVKADVYGTGRIPHASQGLVFVNAEWTAPVLRH